MRKSDIISDPAHGYQAEAFEAYDDFSTNPNLGNTIGDVIQARYGCRDFLRDSLAVTAADSRYTFNELRWGNDKNHHIADGYNADILVRLGDPITVGAPEFAVMNQTAEAQSKPFGYNNDYVRFAEIAPAVACCA